MEDVNQPFFDKICRRLSIHLNVSSTSLYFQVMYCLWCW